MICCVSLAVDVVDVDEIAVSVSSTLLSESANSLNSLFFLFSFLFSFLISLLFEYFKWDRETEIRERNKRRKKKEREREREREIERCPVVGEGIRSRYRLSCEGVNTKFESRNCQTIKLKHTKQKPSAVYVWV